MKKVLFVAISACILATSCSKSDDAPVPIKNTYMTLTAGSTWNYEKTDIQGGGVVSNYTLVSSNRDTSLLGSIYHAFTNSGTASTEYYNIDGDAYSVYRKLHPILGNYTKLVKYLDTDNDVWSEDFTVVVNGMGQTLNLSNNVVEKNVSRVVNGTTYNNVYCVKTDYSYPTISANYFNGYIKSYYAPKYGLIEDSTMLTLLPLIPSFSIYIKETTKLTSAVLQ